MPLIVNTNISSLNAQRQLLKSGSDLEKASARIASGKRINSAADDAAGLAISNRQTSQIRGLDQAVRNANDGVSLIQTAEGALEEVTNILQRMRELAIQSSNGIYSDGDRVTLDAETQQLKSEIDRIADTTSFNGQNVLDGSLGKLSLQVGSQANQTISFKVAGFNTSSLGGSGGDLIGEAVANGISDLRAVTGTAGLTVNDVSLTALTTVNALHVNDALNVLNSDLDGKGAEVSTLVTHEAAGAGDGVLIAGTDTVTIGVVDGDGNTQSYVLTGTSSMDELLNKINTETSVSATLNDAGRLVLSQNNVQSITVTDSTTSDKASGFTNTGAGNFSLVFTDTSADKNGVKVESGGTGATSAELLAVGLNVNDDNGNVLASNLTANATNNINEGDLVINGVSIGAINAGTSISLTLDNVIKEVNKSSGETGVVAFKAAGSTSQLSLRSSDGSPIQVKYGDNATDANVLAITGLQEQNAAVGSGSVAGVSVKTIGAAQSSIDVIDSALDTINKQRSNLGAINNRLDFTVSNLTNITEKTTAARSRIVDADFAAETANLSRAQVLQQASQAMLAQANARPQRVLALLQ